MLRRTFIVLYFTVLASFPDTLVTLAQWSGDAPPTVFTSQPQSSSPEQQGSTKVLLCSTNGSPPPVYRWRLNGAFLSPSSTTDTSHKIVDIRRNDTGAYDCVASNALGALLSVRAAVSVAYMVPFASGPVQEVGVVEGRAAVFDLPAIDCYPAPVVQWADSASNVPIQREATRFQVTLKNQLVVLDARYVDSGKWFRASATNIHTQQSSDSQYFQLSVNPPTTGGIEQTPQLEIVIPPAPTTAIQGESLSVQLECIASCRPLNFLSQRWYRLAPPTSNISPPTRIPILQDNSKYFLSTYQRVLTIRNPTIDDTADYLCEATYNSPPGGLAIAPVSSSATLNVYVKPTIEISPQSEMSRDVSSNVMIDCKAIGTPTPSIRWLRNAVPIDEGRYAMAPNGSLAVRSARTNDSGVFQCVAESTAGSATAATWLRVYSSAPTIVFLPANASVVAGDAAGLSCVASGAPKPSVEWTRGVETTPQRGGRLPVDASGRIRVSDMGLSLQSTEISDAGAYTCTATNALGSVSVVAYLSVTVRTRITQPPQDAAVIKGSTAVVHCGVESDPAVAVAWRWTLEDVAMPTDPARQTVRLDGALEIRSVRAEDIGRYACTVTSRAGGDSAAGNLRVVELPYPPAITLVALTRGSTTGVDVSWTPNFDGNCPVRQYTVQLRVVSQNASQPVDLWQAAPPGLPIPPNLTRTTVSPLLPSRSYQFRIAAVNDVGEGEPSSPSGVIEVPQAPPGGPPRGVVASPRSNSSVLLQWQPPDLEKQNGQLLGYVVRCRPSGYPDSTITSENITGAVAESYMREIGGLLVFQEYEIAIAAYNRKGLGAYSMPVYARTLEGRPTAAPVAMTATAVSSTEVVVNWMPPNPQYINGINQGYRIDAVATVDNSTTSVVVASNTSNMLGQQTALVSGLKKYAGYRITIRCFTAVGLGPASVWIPIITLQDVPDAVASLSFSSVTDTSFVVSWGAPVKANGILISYDLTAYEKATTTGNQSFELPPDSTNFTISSLTAATVYTVVISARTIVGSGPALAADIQSGLTPAIPGPPTSLSVTNVLARSVVVQFAPGFSGHTTISRWTVQCQRDNIENPPDWAECFSIVDPLAKSITVGSLSPARYYRLRISAVNAAGASEPSEPTAWFKTLEAPPSNPPTGVTARAVNDTAIRVSWTPLGADRWNGAGRLYSVQWRRAREADFAFARSVPDELGFCVVSGLTPWRDYEVRVAAVNEVGSSEYGPIAAERTREAAPGAGPTGVVALATGSTSVAVTWGGVEGSARNGIILGYRVIYTKADASITTLATTILVADGNATRCDVTGLLKFVAYVMRVAAYTGAGEGPPSQPGVAVTTLEDLPGPPEGAYFPQVSETTATLVWSAPRQPNGIIIGYRVTYSLRHSIGPVTSINDTLGTSARRLSVSGLTRFTYYVFVVTALTRLGLGDPARLEVYTVSDRRAPDPPTQPLVGSTQRGAHWVVIRWTGGADGYGPIRNFTVQYSEELPPSLSTDAISSFFPAGEISPLLHLEGSLDGVQRKKRAMGGGGVIGKSLGTAYGEKLGRITVNFGAGDAMAITKLGKKRNFHDGVHSREKHETETSFEGREEGSNVKRKRHDTFPYGEKLTKIAKTVAGDVKKIENLGKKRKFHDGVHSRKTREAETSSEHSEGAGLFVGAEDYIAPTATWHNMTGLKPNRVYRFRVAAWNDVGVSAFSNASDPVQTDQAPPDSPPSGLSAAALTSTSVRVSWTLAHLSSWNGPLTGHLVAYRLASTSTDWQSLFVPFPATSCVVGNLALFSSYEIRASSVNARGQSEFGLISVFYLEMAPTGTVREVAITNVTATEITLMWEPPDLKDRNGDILGFRVYAWNSHDSNEKVFVAVRQISRMEVVSFSQTSKTLSNLSPYTWYSITVLAFNAAGNGPNLTDPMIVRTLEDAPGPPENVGFVLVAPTKINVTWDAPVRPNGVVQMYEVSYTQGELVNGISQSVRVMISPNTTSYSTQVIEGMHYSFGVRARTSIGWGPETSVNLTASPQPGCPGTPGKPVCFVGEQSVSLSWLPPDPDGYHLVTEYLVEMKPRSEATWKVVATSVTTSVDVSMLSLAPSTDYQFRVIAVNARGIGYPSDASDPIRAADVLAQLSRPIHQQWWFLVIIALVGVIIIIVVVCVLCLTGRRYRRARDKNFAKAVVRLNDAAAASSNQDGIDDSGFSTYETRQSRRHDRSLRSVVAPSDSWLRPSSSRASTMAAAGPSRGRPLPRPSPGSVKYDNSDSDDDGKISMPDDSSSLSEKRSEAPSPMVEAAAAGGNQADRRVSGPAPTFPNLLYTNGEVLNSWKRSNAGGLGVNYDDDDDGVGGQYNAYSLNRGGQIVMNNTAGSRAPLPGFSSFV